MAIPFISREDLSDYLGRDLTTSDGAMEAIDAACQICRDVAQQSFDVVTAGTAIFDGSGTDALVLRELPVSAVSEVLIDDSAVDDWVLKDNGVLVRKSATFSSSVWSNGLPPSIWPLGRQNITVTYDHGYSTVPSSVRMVALSIAARLVIQGVAQFETVGDVSVRYGTNATDLTKGEERILRLARPS